METREKFTSKIEISKMDSRKFTPEKILNAFETKRPDLVILDEPTEIKSRCTVKSLKCGHSWLAYIPNLLYKHSGCPICYYNAEDYNSYKNRLYLIRPRIEILSKKMEKSNNKMRYRCRDCGIEFDAYPYQFFVRESGHGCPKCGHKLGGEKLRLSQEEFERRICELSPEITILGKYINEQTLIKCSCKRCEYVWESRPNDLMRNGSSCPRCGMSHGEKKISKWFDEYGVEYIYQYKFDNCIDKMKLPYDFYLPKYNACLEYDGEQHYKPIEHFGGKEHFDQVIRHDEIKNSYCTSNGITIWRIPYFEEERLDNELSIFLKYCESKYILGNHTDMISEYSVA